MEKAKLEIENGKLKRRLALYEAEVPLLRKRRSALLKSGARERFPGRPKGYHGSTRPKPKPEIDCSRMEELQGLWISFTPYLRLLIIILSRRFQIPWQFLQ